MWPPRFGPPSKTPHSLSLDAELLNERPVPSADLPRERISVGAQFDVRVGSYPSALDEPARVKITSENPDAVASAADWIRDRIEVVDPPEEREP